VRLILRSLHVRLVLAAGGSILAAVAVFAVATVLVVSHELRSSLDSALRQRAEEVAQLAVSAPAVLTQPGALESPVSGRQIVVEVVDSQGRILARSLTLGARLLPEDRVAFRARAAGVPGFETVSVADRPFRLYAAPIAQAGGPASGGAVLVASDTSDISATIHHLGSVLTLAGIAVALAAVLAAAVLTRRGLVPLRKLAVAGEEIELTADPSRRLPDTGVGDEVGQLTGVLNRMLSSLETARTMERRFLADASHELRTPVTSLLGNVEYAARHGADAEVLADLQRDAARLARLVDDLLVLERAGAPVEEQAAVELEQLVEEVARRHERVVIGPLEPVRVEGDDDELGRVLENLIENALIHGPAGGRVTVGLRAADGRAVLSVSDEGQGPDPRYRDRLFERFWRGPGASERAGSGLGLSIVAAIVERHGGAIVVGGSTFTVSLPAIRTGVAGASG
jgi:signal transduction histidine kinase